MIRGENAGLLSKEPDLARCLLLAVLLLVPTGSRAAPPDFDRDIAPLLASRCLDCHRGPRPRGDLDLSRRAGAASVLVPGKPEDSELWNRVKAGEMPPKKPLGQAEQRLLREWIAGGARWGSDPIDPFRFTSATRAGYDWWALRPVCRPAPQDVRNPNTEIRNEIDRFLTARLGVDGLSPSPPADRRSLIRRVYFDLIGLPPTPEEVDAFQKDKAPDAYERLVERLLASPHHGERWARHWLDVVRFGETDGFERNTVRPNAWPYRDWVVRALNADLPYDEFARLQLAGDVLRPDDPDAVKATGFLVAAVHNTVLGNDQMRAIARQDELEDLVGSIGQTFLGLTVNCARCHDHKFDPIPQADYYRLLAALVGIGHGERVLPDVELNRQVAVTESAIKKLDSELAAIEAPAREAVLAGRGKRPTKPVAPPGAIAAWDFRAGPEDRLGKLHAKPQGGAKLTPEGAVLDGKTGYLRTAPLTSDLKAKTLEAWVKLDGLKQQGGGVLSVESPGGAVFDAIVFGERERGHWMAGSDNFSRTQPFLGHEEKDLQVIHVAIAYTADGTITGYRNGTPYGKPYRSDGPPNYRAGNAVVLFGCRLELGGGDRMLAGTVVAARLYDRALSPQEIAASHAGGPLFVSETEFEEKLSTDQSAKRAALRASRTRLAAELSRLGERANAKVYAVVPQPVGVTRFLHRGDVSTPGDVVTPGRLRAVGGLALDLGLPADAGDAERRRKLAVWIVSADNPLFTRVVVNRVWHHHFGTGLVETPNDFGFNGGRPSHPDLLDWLASEFRNGGYSLKSLHRLIVTSAAYRQGTAPRKEALAIDADNRLLWRMRPRRLDGESLRDALLAVSGLLNPAVGGQGFSDYRERNFNGTAYFDPIDPVGPDFHRRSIYRFVPRGGNSGLLDVFDCPDPAAAAPRRAVTTTPLQALALWNSGFALRCAAAFAARIEREAPGDLVKQVRRAWQLAYQRDPMEEESRLAARLAADHGLEALCRVLLNSNEFLTVG